MKLKEARVRLGMTQTEVANRVGISRQVYNNYETGKRKPDVETTLKLAKVFGTTVEWLIDGDDTLTKLRNQYQDNALQMMFLSLEDQIQEIERMTNEVSAESSQIMKLDTFLPPATLDKTRNIPCFDSISAGFGEYNPDSVIEIMHIFIEDDTEAANTICISVKGDSMYPKIEDGDIIQVRKQTTAENGDIVVILDGDESCIRRIIYGRSGIILESMNQTYPPIRRGIPDNLHIVGVVKRVIRNL